MFFYEIKDSENAGLDPKLIPYFDLSKVEQLTLIEMMNEVEYRERLSKREVQGRVNKYKGDKSLN